jgi:hypothetical protein|tara:strand:- start:976 stop:1143 length:168 start_codon:yes stop_codon:yes gene_type:complete
MDDLMDMILQDESPNNISDKIKNVLFAKSAEKIDALKPSIGNAVFDETEVESEEE